MIDCDERRRRHHRSQRARTLAGRLRGRPRYWTLRLGTWLRAKLPPCEMSVMSVTDPERRNEPRASARPLTLCPRAAVATLPVYTRGTTGHVPIRWRASSNEAPVPPSPAVVAAVAKAAANGHRYPVLHGDELVDSLACGLGVHPGRIAVGQGALALLDQLLLAYVEPQQKVVYPWRSYEAYPISITVAHACGVPVLNTPSGALDLAALAAALRAANDPAVLIVCNPNNPTGTAFGLEELKELLAGVRDDVLVVLDEAYRDFVPERLALESAQLQADCPNLVILRTFSKAYALAGFRVGYAIAAPEVVTALRAVQPPFPVSAPAVAAAQAALADRAHHDQLVHDVVRCRDELAAALAEAGLPATESATNFVWLPLGERAEEAAEACSAAGIAVRCFAGEGVRITVGEPGLTAAAVSALRSFAL